MHISSLTGVLHFCMRNTAAVPDLGHTLVDAVHMKHQVSRCSCALCE